MSTQDEMEAILKEAAELENRRKEREKNHKLFKYICIYFPIFFLIVVIIDKYII